MLLFTMQALTLVFFVCRRSTRSSMEEIVKPSLTTSESNFESENNTSKSAADVFEYEAIFWAR